MGNQPLRNEIDQCRAAQNSWIGGFWRPRFDRFSKYSLPCFPPPTTCCVLGSKTGPEEPRSISSVSVSRSLTFEGANQSACFRSGLSLKKLLPYSSPGLNVPLPVIT